MGTKSLVLDKIVDAYFLVLAENRQLKSALQDNKTSAMREEIARLREDNERLSLENVNLHTRASYASKI